MTTSVYSTLYCSFNPFIGSGTPATVERLLEILATYTLCPTFEEYGNFIGPARRSRPFYNEACSRIEYLDDGPVYPESPSAVAFFGNFHNVSCAFRVITADQRTIDILTRAIRANQASAAYCRARESLLPTRRTPPARAGRRSVYRHAQTGGAL